MIQTEPKNPNPLPFQIRSYNMAPPKSSNDRRKSTSSLCGSIDFLHCEVGEGTGGLLTVVTFVSFAQVKLQRLGLTILYTPLLARMKTSFLLSSPNENMYSRAAKRLFGTELQAIGESVAQLKGMEVVVKFPLVIGVSAAAHIALEYKSPYK